MLLLMLGAMQQAPHLLQSMAQLYGVGKSLALQLASRSNREVTHADLFREQYGDEALGAGGQRQGLSQAAPALSPAAFSTPRAVEAPAINEGTSTSTRATQTQAMPPITKAVGTLEASAT